MQNIYLAARYGRRLELAEHAAQLQKLGFHVVSRWVFGGHEIEDAVFNHASRERKNEIGAKFAIDDEIDIDRADIFIAFSEPLNDSAYITPDQARGGWNVEFGMARKQGKKLILIGPRVNMFHCLPSIQQYDTWEDFIKQLKQKEEEACRS